METKGINFLRSSLAHYQRRVDLRYKQYDMKYQDRQAGIVIPEKLRGLYRSTLGWCATAVDAMADRIVFKGFQNDNFGFSEIFQMNNPDIFFDSAILSALIASCAFVYISEGEEAFPRLQVIEASNATGVIDPITGLLKEGYAVLKRDSFDRPLVEAYFLPDRTIIYEKEKVESVYMHSAGHPLLVPIIHRPDAVRPFGRSRITRAAMYCQKLAKRTLERADVTAEFYSFPQKYILGMDSDAEQWDEWKATIASMLRIDTNENGDTPKLGQFTSASMSPFVEQFRMAASVFAGETGLTLDDLGFISDNPSSSEAIKASHETLRLSARKAQRCFSSGIINVGYVATCLRDKYPYLRNRIYETKVKWYPVFEPDASTMSFIGDGFIKLNQAIPGIVDEEDARDILGMESRNG